MAERKNYPLRLAPEVYEALRRWADDEMRSVNAQIEFLLSKALREAGRGKTLTPNPSPDPSRPPSPGEGNPLPKKK
ncbi:MAG TPA: hypothetical protein VF789_34670 [Thermoanaerobaculia bacterium]